MFNRQQIFDKVARHLLTQGKRCMRQNATTGVAQGCLYRNEIGERCAVGCLIDDDAYDRELEGQSAFNDNVIEAIARSGVDAESFKKIGPQLQSIHDYCDPSLWEVRLRCLATEMLVSDSVIDDIEAEQSAAATILPAPGKRSAHVPAMAAVS